jgi:uncharacterized membrane protein YkoI
MITRNLYLSAVIAALLCLSSAGIAQATERAQSASLSADTAFLTSSFAAPEQTRQMLAQRKISAADAKSIALKRVRGGEVVDISKNGNTYRVRVIAKDGRVVDVYIDANTGRVKR